MNRQEEMRNKLWNYIIDNEVTLKYVSERSQLPYNLLSKFKNNKIDLEPETLIVLEIFLETIQDD